MRRWVFDSRETFQPVLLATIRSSCNEKVSMDDCRPEEWGLGRHDDVVSGWRMAAYINIVSLFRARRGYSDNGSYGLRES